MHEDLFPGEYNQQYILVKYKTPIPEQMMQVYKEAERQKAKIEKNRATIEQKILPRFKDCEEELSFSSISMYSLDFGE